MLTWERPFSGASFERGASRPRRRLVEAGVPPAVADVVTGLLHPDPAQRSPAPAEELARLVRTARESATPTETSLGKTGSSSAAPSTPAARPRPAARSREGRPMVSVDGGLVELVLPGGRLVEVRVPPFLIDKHLVTRGDYLRYLEATGSPRPSTWERARPSRADLSLPVTGVSFAEAEAYAAWEGRRLPTEAQWELAARGPDGWCFPWGDEWQSGLSHQTYRRPWSDRAPGPIGVFSPQGDSPFGVSDLLQIWEWVAAPYQAAGDLVRGGPWRDRCEPALLENRSWEDGPAVDVGFRCAANDA